MKGEGEDKRRERRNWQAFHNAQNGEMIITSSTRQEMKVSSLVSFCNILSFPFHLLILPVNIVLQCLSLTRACVSLS